MKEQSKQWTLPGEPALKKAKIVKSAGKVMVILFWNARDIIHIDYFPSKQMINGDYYALLDRFNNILKKIRLHLAKKKMLFHQDNAWVHTCPAPMAKFNEFRYELFPHPAYSPDLDPCDYFLFPNLKKGSEESSGSSPESSSLKQRLILDWTNNIIRTACKSWRIVGSSISS